MMFAAGFGTRMGDLTASRPKPMINVAGKPLVDHALDLAMAIDPRVVVANVHYLPDVLEQHLAPKDVQLSHEVPDILETGGGLRQALPLLGDGPVFTLNTDAVWRGPNPLQILRDAWDPDRMDALLMCVEKDNAVGHSGRGDFVPGPSGEAQRGPGLVYAGVQIVKTDKLHTINERVFSLNLLWDEMLRTGRLHVLPYPGQWCDVGSVPGIGLAETMLGYGDV